MFLQWEGNYTYSICNNPIRLLKFYMKMIVISSFIFWLECQTNIWYNNQCKTLRLFSVSDPSICLLKKNICCLLKKTKSCFHISFSAYFSCFYILWFAFPFLASLAFLSNQSHCPELVNLSYFLIKPITHPMANQSTNSFSKQPISHHHHDCCCFCLKKVKKYLYFNVLTYMYVVAHVHGSFETLSQNLDAL